MKQNLKSSLGFGLIESVIAMSIGVLVALSLTTITIYGLKNARGLKEKELLYSSTNFFTQRIAFLMKQAKKFETPSPSTLQITLSDKTVVVEKSGNDILIEGKKANAAGVTVEELKFTTMQRSVRINFVFKSGNERFMATTTIARRNAL